MPDEDGASTRPTGDPDLTRPALYDRNDTTAHLDGHRQSQLSDAALRSIAARAETIGEVTTALGLVPCGRANEAARQELKRVGLPDPTWRGGRPAPRRVYPSPRDRRTGPYIPADGQPNSHRATWSAHDIDRLRAAMLQVTPESEQRFGVVVTALAVEMDRTVDAVVAKVRELGVRPAPSAVCLHCGLHLRHPVGRGRARRYCNERCRDRHRRAAPARTVHAEACPAAQA